MKAFSSVNLLGRMGRGMWFDRLLEYVNLLQQKRMVAFQGFDKALHHTPLLQAMLHVDHAYCEATQGSSPTEFPMTNSMLNQVRVLQDFFLATLGRDLTTPNSTNPYWWTMKATDFYAGDFRFQQPWIWAERVSNGRSKGVWGAKLAWPQHVDDFIARGGLWVQPEPE